MDGRVTYDISRSRPTWFWRDRPFHCRTGAGHRRRARPASEEADGPRSEDAPAGQGTLRNREGAGPPACEARPGKSGGPSTPCSMTSCSGALPHHPQLTHKRVAREHRAGRRSQGRLLRRFVDGDGVLLEVGRGLRAALRMATFVKRVIAVDVSDEITKALNTPENFRLILSDGCSIPVPEGSVTSCTAISHGTPASRRRLRSAAANICRAPGAPGRMYFCVTPNRSADPTTCPGTSTALRPAST